MKSSTIPVMENNVNITYQVMGRQKITQNIIHDYLSKRIVSFIVVIINGVAVQEVVSNHFRIIEFGFLAVSTPIHPPMSCLLATKLIGPIC